MAHFDSEAQLASVLGHEIGHVTARHSASQITQQQLAQLGLGVGVLLAPDLADFAGLAQAGLGLLFLRFSRDDERQADLLGFRYMTSENYDAREMPGVFRMLGRITQASGGGGVPGWLSTHPEPDDREARIQQMIVESQRNFDNTTVGRNDYVRRLDGLVYGENPREGYFRDQTFLHPDLQFMIDFPSGWIVVNQKQAVIGQSPNKDALMQLSVIEAADARSAATAFAGQEGVSASSVRSEIISGLPAASTAFTAQTEQAVLAGSVTFVEYGGNVYRLLAYSTSNRWSGYAGTIRQSVQSFDRLTDRNALRVQPLRVRIVELDRAMTLAEFNQRYPSPISLESLAIVNQVEPQTRLAAGSLIKRVDGTLAR
jgi:predicted Zn-dependent protease